MVKKTKKPSNPDLSIKLCGVMFENPTVLFSGIYESPQDLINASKNGAGAITTKSVSIGLREGHPQPRIVKFDHGFINSVGLKNPGLEKAKEELKKMLLESKSPVIASIFADKTSDFQKLAKEITEVKPHILELNLSCPNVEGEFGRPFATDAKISAKVVRAVKKVSKKVPVIAKLTPNVLDIKEIARAVEGAGADGISAINTIGPGMIIDIKTKKAKLGNKRGGVSGPAIKPVAIRCIFDIYEAVKIPIIGGGGITTGEDAIEIIMAGATAVGIGSAVYLRGRNVFSEICKEMKVFMKKEGYKSLKEIRGAAH
ncbi:MAG: dihydroorotate dehydrogenase [Patescibacteria group bacterium]|nr:dihydroorotate dehydrogenase [Patescibacteria group bacterium]